MARVSLVLFFYIVTCFTNGSTKVEDSIGEIYQVEANSTVERVVGRAYSVSTCDYRTQLGYTCMTCNRALHCYPGNVAIVVDCYGLWRFCRDGRCSLHQGDKCLSEQDTKLTTPSVLDGSPVSDVTTKIAEDFVPLDSKPRVDNDVVSPSSDNVV